MHQAQVHKHSQAQWVELNSRKNKHSIFHEFIGILNRWGHWCLDRTVSSWKNKQSYSDNEQKPFQITKRSQQKVTLERFEQSFKDYRKMWQTERLSYLMQISGIRIINTELYISLIKYESHFKHADWNIRVLSINTDKICMVAWCSCVACPWHMCRVT